MRAARSPSALTSIPRINAASDLETQIQGLCGLDRKHLIGEFQRLYRAPPSRLSDSILRMAIAYRWQEEVLGGLVPAIRAQILAGALHAPRRATPGTVFIREWQGREHTVVVHSDRVEYAGNTYRSLTEVACRITGQKRSGPAFFGLRSNDGKRAMAHG